MSKIDSLVAVVTFALADTDPKDESEIRELVKAYSLGTAMKLKDSFTDEDIEDAVLKVRERNVHRMGAGAIFEVDYNPWLDARRDEIDWHYWQRYKKHLIGNKEFSGPVVKTLDEITDNILDRLQDPRISGAWARRGMVVGDVQSGKTANYTGLVCKAADAGYKVIIIMAGMLNSLRNQTQERLDADFLGWCTRQKIPIGVAGFGDSKRPVCFTTSESDFSKPTASTIALSLDNLNVPLVFVVKKNKSTLENLHGWLLEHNKHDLRAHAMLLIDDEADHASINTNADDDDPTAINLGIRMLLSAFPRNAFVGYTATPYANIFIDPESETEMIAGEAYKDLFPKDFILSLDPPTNYVGPAAIFSDDPSVKCIVEIDDDIKHLPPKHPVTFHPEFLPDGLLDAIDCFFISKAVRLMRGQCKKHHSMMINVTRFTQIQNHLKSLVVDRVAEVRQAVRNYSALPVEEALKDASIRHLHSSWVKHFEEFSPVEFDWPDVQRRLKEACSQVEVLCINSSSGDRLDFSRSQYPDGRTVIAVGGLGLSRGLTLEGLQISYFIRNSIMYDTLLQMGRWFGYRDGYVDLCRIFMTSKAKAWYAHVADVTEELREDFRKMERMNATPKEFGLRVRADPEALIITARNKMRHAVEVLHKVSLEGRLIETVALPGDDESIAHNLAAVDKMVRLLQSGSGCMPLMRTKLGYEWDDVPVELISSFLGDFRSCPQSLYTYNHKPLIAYLKEVCGFGGLCRVLLKTLAQTTNDEVLPVGKDLIGKIQTRGATVDWQDAKMISFLKKRRVGDPSDESAGVTEAQLEEIRRRLSGNRTVNPKEYRSLPGRKPLLILHLIDLEVPHRPVRIAAYGLSFPGSTARRNPVTVEYAVNAIWLRSVHAGEEDWDEVADE